MIGIVDIHHGFFLGTALGIELFANVSLHALALLNEELFGTAKESTNDLVLGYFAKVQSGPLRLQELFIFLADCEEFVGQLFQFLCQQRPHFILGLCHEVLRRESHIDPVHFGLFLQIQ